MASYITNRREDVCYRLASGRSAVGSKPFRGNSRCMIFPKAVVAPLTNRQEYKPIPTLTGQLPLLGTVGKYPSNEVFLPVEEDFQAKQCRCLDVNVAGVHVYYTRHPKDIAMAAKSPEVWQKTSSWANLHRWLGSGLASELDPAKHLQAREMLAPAFKAQSVKDLVPMFADVAQRLTAIMKDKQEQELGQSVVTALHTPDISVSVAQAVSDAYEQSRKMDMPVQYALWSLPAVISADRALNVHTITAASLHRSSLLYKCAPLSVAAHLVVTCTAADIESLTRRATLDVIGRAGFGYDFKALELYTGSGFDETGIDVVQAFRDIIPTANNLFTNVWLPEVLVPGYQRYVKAIEKLEVVVQQMLRDCRMAGVSHVDRSLLGAMLRVQQADPEGFVTDEHIRDQLMTFMFAGSNTTANTMAFCLHEISQRPHVQAMIQQELQQVLGDTPTDQLTPDMFTQLPYLTSCINETVRLYPSAPSLTRKLTQDQICGDHVIPSGSYAVLAVFSCHRHADFWARPTEWLPERWLPENIKQLGTQAPEAFVPFSSGIRSCIGRYFAMLEMQVILAVLLHQVSVKPTPGNQQLQLVQNFVLTSKDGIHLQAAAR